MFLPSRGSIDPWSGKKRRLVSALGFAAFFAVLWLLGRWLQMELSVEEIRAWVLRSGVWGPFTFAAIYLVLILAFVPGTPLTVLAALLFGSARGLAVMVFATTLAASTGFLVARYLARERVERWLSSCEACQRFVAMVERNWRIAILFLRVAPVLPFTAVNYAFGLTQVGFWRYLLWSELAMVPMNALWVLGSDGVYSSVSRGEVPWATFGIAVAAAVLVLGLGYLGKRTLGPERSPAPETARAPDRPDRSGGAPLV
jgi:uncharacterized membrane protein YdjX (TVP38/TMEM64 family)